MDNKILNINNYKKIKKYINNIEKLEPYLQNKEVVQFAKEDFSEIKNIQIELSKKGKLDYALKTKEVVNLEVDHLKSTEISVINVYRKINDELHSWRNIYLNII